MAKPQQIQQKQTLAPAVQFRTCTMFRDSLAAHKELFPKLEEFRKTKAQNPIAKFGGRDYPFTGAGVFASEVPGLAHAHLTQDISVVYRVHSKNPTLVDIYGLYSHAELGTGQPANIKKQKSMGRRFANQEFT